MNFNKCPSQNNLDLIVSVLSGKRSPDLFLKGRLGKRVKNQSLLATPIRCKLPDLSFTNKMSLKLLCVHVLCTGWHPAHRCACTELKILQSPRGALQNLIPATARDTNHVKITASNPITFMDPACSRILCNDTKSAPAETGKQWVLPFFFLFTLNCWHGAKFSTLKVFPCVTSNRIQVSDNLRLFQT